MLQGLSLLGPLLGDPGPAPFQALNPATGEALDPAFHSASDAEVDRAVDLAREAAPVLEALGGPGRGELLREIAKGLEDAAAELVPRVFGGAVPLSSSAHLRPFSAFLRVGSCL
jgi:NADP-dependent aldehyde dehydrogenase